jgi:hypothetical protein
MRRATVVLVVMLAFGTSGCGKKVYTRDDFQKAVLGLNADQLRGKLGAPDRIDAGEGGAMWVYSKRTVDPKTGKPEEWVAVFLENDRVSHVGFSGTPGG